MVDIGSDGREIPSRYYLAELEAVAESGKPRVKIKVFANGESVETMRNRVYGCS